MSTLLLSLGGVKGTGKRRLGRTRTLLGQQLLIGDLFKSDFGSIFVEISLPSIQHLLFFFAKSF